MEAYHFFISKKEVLEMPFLKLIFAGTPRVGKTTALRRLMGKIINLFAAGEANLAHPSTGAVEFMGNVIVKKNVQLHCFGHRSELVCSRK